MNLNQCHFFSHTNSLSKDNYSHGKAVMYLTVSRLLKVWIMASYSLFSTAFILSKTRFWKGGSINWKNIC